MGDENDLEKRWAEDGPPGMGPDGKLVTVEDADEVPDLEEGVLDE